MNAREELARKIVETVVTAGWHPPTGTNVEMCDGFATVAQLKALLGVDLWEVRSFTADIRITFSKDGNITDATLLNPARSGA